MGSFMNFLHVGWGNMSIDFRRSDADVAEQQLDRAQVSTSCQQMGRKRVTQRMRMKIRWQARQLRIAFDHLPEHDPAESSPAGSWK